MNYSELKSDFNGLCNALLSASEIVETERGGRAIEHNCNGVKIRRQWLPKGVWNCIYINGKLSSAATAEERAQVHLYAESFDFSKCRYENGRPYFLNYAKVGASERPTRVVSSTNVTPTLKNYLAILLKATPEEVAEAEKALAKVCDKIKARLLAEVKAEQLASVHAKWKDEGAMRVNSNEIEVLGDDLFKPWTDEDGEHKVEKLLVCPIGLTATAGTWVKNNIARVVMDF